VARGRGQLCTVAAILAAAAAGCGLGPGDSSEGKATLTVTRDYGSDRLLEAAVEDPAESETVMRFLDREADIETRYGGGFVQAIEGIEGGFEDGRGFDWLYYVNGVWSSVGAAEREVEPGDRIWWDHRDWTDAMRVPAVVGSWPEPFVHGYEGEELTVAVECAGARAACDAVAASLDDAGADMARGTGDGLRVLVGSWRNVREDPAAAQIEEGPAVSGVFADIEREGGAYELLALDVRGSPARRMRAHAGLVGAVRLADDPPTWIVTGTDARGVEAAAGLFDEEHLRDRYAVAVAGGRELALPVVE
jgi:Domain of unknown function (DUF4430)